MRISDWSSDVCSSDLVAAARQAAVAVLQDGAVRPHALDTPLEARQQHLRARFDFLIDRAATVLTALRIEAHQVLERCSALQKAARNIQQIGRASVRERVCQYV